MSAKAWWRRDPANDVDSVSQSTLYPGLSSHHHPRLGPHPVFRAAHYLQGWHTLAWATCTPDTLLPTAPLILPGRWGLALADRGFHFRMLPLVPCLSHPNLGIRKFLLNLPGVPLASVGVVSYNPFRGPQATLITMQMCPLAGSPRVRTQALTPVSQRKGCSVAPGE